MSLGTILLIVLLLMLVGVIPTWPHSRSWGYAPSGILGLVLVIVVVLLLMGMFENLCVQKRTAQARPLNYLPAQIQTRLYCAN